MKKIALCFIISYQHILHKEHIWREWIEHNKDIINVYFHYKDISCIQSEWIRSHCIPAPNPTTYYHVVPAYMAVLSYAFHHDTNNKWFCLLTESCVPIIHPSKFRFLFQNTCQASIFQWKPAHWNIDIHLRANLRYFNKEYRLANTPWFIFTRDHVHKSILFMVKKNDIYQKVCKGGLANESLFAIILQTFGELKNPFTLINCNSTLMDWSRMSNATSPHIFKDGTEQDIAFITNELTKNKYSIFLRKVATEFPDEILHNFIYHTNINHEYYYVNSKKIYYFLLVLGLFLFYSFFYSFTF